MGTEYAFRTVPDPADFGSALALVRRLTAGAWGQAYTAVRLASREPAQLVRVSEELGDGVTWTPPEGPPDKAELDRVAVRFFELVRRSKERGEFRLEVGCRFRGGGLAPPWGQPPPTFTFMRDRNWPGSVDIRYGVARSADDHRRRWGFYGTALHALGLNDVWRILDEAKPTAWTSRGWTETGVRSTADDVNLRCNLWDVFGPGNLSLTPADPDQAVSMFNTLKDGLVDTFLGYSVTVGGRPVPGSDESIMTLVPRPGGEFSYFTHMQRELDDEYLRRLDGIAREFWVMLFWLPLGPNPHGPGPAETVPPLEYSTSLEKKEGRYTVYVRSKAFRDRENLEFLERKYGIRLEFVPEHSGAPTLPWSRAV